MALNEFEVRFDQTVFCIESVKKALYRLADRLDAEVRTDGTTIVCVLRSKKSADLDKLAILFRQEVLDQDLRISIRQQTEGIRNIVLAYAFSKTGLVQSE